MKNHILENTRTPTVRKLVMSLFDATGSYEEDLYYTHDAQKNTKALFGIKAGRRALYLYGAYGNLIKIDGAISSLNPFRFSSEYHDDELALIYYNYRYLNPKDGRWINRDMVFRDYNEYLFVGNSPSYYIDVKGQEKAPTAFQTYPVNPTPQPRPMPTPSNTANAAGSALAEVINAIKFFRGGWRAEVQIECQNYCRDYIQKAKIKQGGSCCSCTYDVEDTALGQVKNLAFSLYSVSITPCVTCKNPFKGPSLIAREELFLRAPKKEEKTPGPPINITFPGKNQQEPPHREHFDV